MNAGTKKRYVCGSKNGWRRDVMDGGGCGFYGMLFYEAGLICDFLRRPSRGGKWLSGFKKSFPVAGNGFRISKSHFPRRETASRFQKVISRDGKRFSDFKKSFPATGNGFWTSKGHFPRREVGLATRRLPAAGRWPPQGFFGVCMGHKKIAQQRRRGVSSRLEGVGARGRPRRRRRSSASSRRERACAPGG